MLSAIVALGLALRLIGIGQSLGGDEYFSLYWLHEGLEYVQGPGRLVEGNPPLFYTLLFGWIRMFGLGEASVRLPSVLASALTIAVVFELGRALADRRAGLIAAALFALNPVQVFYAQEARSYGLQVLLAALCLLSLSIFLRGARGARGRAEGLAVYCGAAILLARMHYAQTFFVASCALGGLAACLRLRPQARRAGEWIAANALVFAATIGEVPDMLHATGSPSVTLIRMPPGDIPGNLAIMLSGVPLPLPACLLSAFVLLCGREAWRAGNSAKPLIRVVLVEIPALYIGLLLLANCWHPVFVARILIVLAVPASVVVGMFVASLATQRARAATLTAVAALFLAAEPFYREAFSAREVLAEMARQAKPGDVIVFGPHDPIAALDYYQPQLMTGGVWRWTADDVIPMMVEDRLWADLFPVKPLDTTGLAADIARGGTVWLFLTKPKAFYAPFAARLGRPADRIVSGPGLTLYNWVGSSMPQTGR